MAINKSMPKINNYLKGFQNNLPGMKDYRHASRLFLDDNFKLLPKQKFLFYVRFFTNENLFIDGFSAAERFQLGYLVKSCELPRYGLNVEEKTAYNKKMYAATRIQYDPINITFHDDHADTVNAFWKKYYEYHIADSVNFRSDAQISATRQNEYDSIQSDSVKTRLNKYGMDTPVQRKKPYLERIEIFVLHKKRFTSMSLINPIIGSFNHDIVDHADGAGVMQNVMQILYETVTYKSGIITKNDVPGFATINYDNEPSPLTVFGRGTNTIFGPGGVIDGIGSVMRSYRQGNILGAILAASNTYNNAKKIKKANVKQELRGLTKKGINEIAKRAGGVNQSPIGAFKVGAAILANRKIAKARGTSDNTSGQLTNTITNSTLDTTIYLTPDEAFNLVSTNSSVRDEVAAGIYFKDIGSRKNLTVAQSDVEYTGATDTTKTVYRNKTITNIRKLVTDGYIRILRSSQEVNIVVEKASL